ncbi:hypothetical protein DPM13_05615 [Paracoccus mutanolyticus]|uniref:Calcium-binding protein n=1 Tax=Paracoccus mutanolyticus TaxID=1499308 RepID=A0ABN5M7R0_9RHOB|nr:hypothetical protein DPM13_05615 [Paracoccus mutanolyticus]
MPCRGRDDRAWRRRGRRHPDRRHAGVGLSGGDGADLFVIGAAQGTIIIRDFEKGVDQLDFSNLGMIRSTLQLSYRWQWDGIRIAFGDTIIIIRTRDGSTLQTSDFDNSIFPVAHYQPPAPSANRLGTGLDDRLFAGATGGAIYGFNGSDLLGGGIGNDTILGGMGLDTLLGGPGRDRLLGEWGTDLLRGGDGDDELYGGDANDTLFGGNGLDSLYGQAGNDLIYGGRATT